MEYGHHACFALLPPNPQPFNDVASDILAADSRDVAAHQDTWWPPPFTQADAENLVK
jgi:hypothetical protein